jgi:hypothetical protein
MTSGPSMGSSWTAWPGHRKNLWAQGLEPPISPCKGGPKTPVKALPTRPIYVAAAVGGLPWATGAWAATSTDEEPISGDIDSASGRLPQLRRREP